MNDEQFVKIEKLLMNIESHLGTIKWIMLAPIVLALIIFMMGSCGILGLW